MKFVCLGYLDESRWEAMSEGERSAFLEECCAFGDELRRGGHVVGGVPLRRGRDGRDAPCTATGRSSSPTGRSPRPRNSSGAS